MNPITPVNLRSNDGGIITETVSTTAEYQRPVMLIPRRAAMKERTDHQLDTARRLEDKPGIFVAWTKRKSALRSTGQNQSCRTTKFQIPISAPPVFLNQIRGFPLA